MHGYKSLSVTARDSGEDASITISLLTGRSQQATCYARKIFPMDQAPEVRDILGWASLAFLTAADELHEDGWEIVHAADCDEVHVELTDA